MNALTLNDAFKGAGITAALEAPLPLWKTMGKDEYRQYQYEEQRRQLEANLAAKAATVFTPAPAPQPMRWVPMAMQQQSGALLYKK